MSFGIKLFATSHASRFSAYSTGNLIGCVAVDIAYTDMNKFLTLHKIHDESEVSIVRLRDDTVFGDTIDAALPYPIHVTETDIISAENYFKLKSAFDMKTNWTSGSVVYEVIVGDNAVYTANVLPFPPDEYDPDYKPEFMIIHAISNDVFAVVERMKDEIDSEVLRMSLLAIGVGLVGMCMVVFIVWFVSRTLTQPLLWIERVAWGIVNHADEQAERSFGRVSEGEELQTAGTCVPSTEISKLVSEFRAMITGFSGSGASTVAQSDLHEIKNEITWQSDYQQLYSDAAAIVTKSEGMLFCNDDDNSGEIGWSKNPTISQSAAQLETAKQSDEIGNSLIVPAPRKRNIGRNVVALPGEMDKKSIKNEFGDRKMPAYRSSLFWWILVLIALPLVLTNAAICAVVSFNIVDTFPAWHYVVAEASVKIEIEALQSVTCLKAKQAEMSIQNVVRDLHFITRVAGWLLFDGIARSDSFCHIDEGTQECRNFPADRSCPFFENPNRAACACEWEDLNALPCIDYTDVDSRSLQTLFFMSQARDADTSTGNRNASSSFGIGIDDSPNTTLWWDNIDELPGAEKGSNSSGFETAYDRLRVSAATSIALIPVYNYATAFNKKKQELTEALAFEADGLFMGFSGCSHQNTFGAHFESTTENMATIVAPNLCPEGKFGCKSLLFDVDRGFGYRKRPYLVFMLTLLIVFSFSSRRPEMQGLVCQRQELIRANGPTCRHNRSVFVWVGRFRLCRCERNVPCRQSSHGKICWSNHYRFLPFRCAQSPRLSHRPRILRDHARRRLVRRQYGGRAKQVYGVGICSHRKPCSFPRRSGFGTEGSI